MRLLLRTAARRLGTRGFGTASGSPVQYINPHRSNAEELINKVPVIKVKGDLATCNGGGGALGHPIECVCLTLLVTLVRRYITLVGDEIAVCKYCGLRYQRDDDHVH